MVREIEIKKNKEDKERDKRIKELEKRVKKIEEILGGKK